MNTNEAEILHNLIEDLLSTSDKTVQFFISKLDDNGTLGSNIKDICCYYKLPMMLIHAGKPNEAKQVLNFIKNKYMLSSGDFCISTDKKSANVELSGYWAYINIWILRAAQYLKNIEMTNIGFHYLEQFNTDNGFLTNQPHHPNNTTDILSTAHYGLLNLERDNLKVAISCGNYLCEAIKKQPDIDQGFFLRFDSKDKKVITTYPEQMTPFYFIDRHKPDQLYFMLGYPCAFLASLYKKTQDPKFLLAAKEIFDFALSCHNTLQCNFSHKIAWAASLLYEITHEPKYLNALVQLINHFVSIQKDGMWYLDQGVNTAYDQSAELAGWFLEIANRLKH